MTYKDIIDTIKQGLLGNPEKDIKYLKSKIEEYKSHEFSQEVIRECASLIFDLLPDDEKKSFDEAINSDMERYESEFKKVNLYISKKKFKKAKNAVESLISNLETVGLNKEDEVTRYFDFRELFEEIIFRQYFEIEKNVKYALFPFSDIYLQYGIILYELNKYEEAKTALLKSLEWNPIRLDSRFEYMENCKRLHQLDEHFKHAQTAIKFAFKKPDILRCFRNFGWYFIEKEEYLAAMICFIQSLDPEKENKNAMQELFYIQTKTGKEIKLPKKQNIIQLSEELGFPVTPNQELLEIALVLGKEWEQDNPDASKYLLSIANDLICEDE